MFGAIRFHGVALLVTAALIGCGRGTKPGQLPVYPTCGTVIFEGEPLPGAIVTLTPVESDKIPDGPKKRPASGGRTNEVGEFVLSTYTTDDGAPEGDYYVTISCENREAKKVGGEYPEFLPERYQAAVYSKLRVTISEGINELEPFVLTKAPPKK